MSSVKPYPISYDYENTHRIVSDICQNIFINNGNIEKYFTKSVSKENVNQIFLNLFIQSWDGFNDTSPTFDEQIEEILS